MTTNRAVLFLAALLAVPSVARAASVWTASTMEKIRPDARPRSDATAQIEAAQNEFEAFQVVVTGPASHVRAEASDLSGPKTIGGVALYREDLIDVRTPSSLDGGTGRYPDALVPDVDDVVGERRNAFPFDVGDGESRAIWVEVHVPADAPTGIYQGTVHVSWDGGDATVPVKLLVFDFALPSTASLKSAFGIAYGTLGSAHGVSGDALSALRQRYAQLALDHRISLSGVADDGNGDWGHFDRFYGPLLDGSAGTRLAGAKLTALKFNGDRNSSGSYGDWGRHAREHGWFDRLFDYTCDEPPLTCQWSDIPARQAVVKAGDPGLRTLVTTTVQEANRNGVLSSIDVIVPVINWLDDKPGHELAGGQTAAYTPFLASAKGKELWTYQSCMSHGCGGTVDIGNPSDTDRYYTGWPSYMIDASPIRARAMEWMSFRYGATGELYWETTMAYTHDAWSNQWDFSGNGDGTLFYPGTPSRIGGQTDIPVASIRLKMIREGMEDYEYLKRLADDGDPQMAQQMAAKLFPDAYGAEQDPHELAAAREGIAIRILQLEGKSLPMEGGGCSTGASRGLLALVLAAAALVARRRRAG